MEPWH